MRYLFPFQEHIKQDKEALFNGAVLNWPRYFRETENCDPTSYVDKMNIDSRFSIYSKTTKRFNKTSYEHSDITKELEEIALPLVPMITKKFQ